MAAAAYWRTTPSRPFALLAWRQLFVPLTWFGTVASRRAAFCPLHRRVEIVVEWCAASLNLSRCFPFPDYSRSLSCGFSPREFFLSFQERSLSPSVKSRGSSNASVTVVEVVGVLRSFPLPNLGVVGLRVVETRSGERVGNRSTNLGWSSIFVDGIQWMRGIEGVRRKHDIVNPSVKTLQC